MKTMALTYVIAEEVVLKRRTEKDCALLLCRGSGGSCADTLWNRALAALIFPDMDYSMTLTPGGEVYTIAFSASALPELLRLETDRPALLLPDPCEEFVEYYAATWAVLKTAPSESLQYVFESSVSALLSWVALLARESGRLPAATHSRQLVEQAKAIVHAEYATDLSLQSVAERLFVNPCYLSTIFHQTTGVTFRSYLKTLRLRHTKRLLTETNYLITDIAMQTGWGSTAYLISSFRQAYGVTPNAYRSLHAKRR